VLDIAVTQFIFIRWRGQRRAPNTNFLTADSLALRFRNLFLSAGAASAARRIRISFLAISLHRRPRGRQAIAPPSYGLLDMDGMIAKHCAVTGEPEPETVDDRQQLHLKLLYEVLDSLEDKDDQGGSKASEPTV
jgi:hypothetical protein